MLQLVGDIWSFLNSQMRVTFLNLKRPEVCVIYAYCLGSFWSAWRETSPKGVTQR